MMIEKTITMLPIDLLIMRIPLVSNFSLTLSISHVNPNHHNKAPAIILKYPSVISIGWLGTTKANWANVAMKRKMINGFDTVTKKAVTPL